MAQLKIKSQARLGSAGLLELACLARKLARKHFSHQTGGERRPSRSRCGVRGRDDRRDARRADGTRYAHGATTWLGGRLARESQRRQQGRSGLEAASQAARAVQWLGMWRRVGRARPAL